MKTLVAICAVTALAINACALSPKIALGVKVVDEAMCPFTGMPIVCVFTDRTYLGDEVYSVTTNTTMESGVARFSGRSYDGWADYRIPEKEGFYRVDGILTRFTNMTEFVFKKWLPYDEVQTVTLQKVGKKIPLFVKEAYPKRNQDLTTASDRKFCYDLVKGDWMPPFGKGEQADIEFKLLPREDFGMGMGPSGIPDPAFRDTIQVEFVGNDNGIVKVLPPPGAVLKVRTAPQDGYRSKFNIWFGQTKTMQDDTNIDKEACHAFRIRTVRNERGEIVSALYGKIYGDFRISYRYYLIPTGVEFTYYLNLTPNDRNLEWDMEHNLCPVRDSFTSHDFCRDKRRADAGDERMAEAGGPEGNRSSRRNA